MWQEVTARVVAEVTAGVATKSPNEACDEGSKGAEAVFRTTVKFHQVANRGYTT